MADVEKSWYTKYRPSTIQDYCGDSIRELISKRFSKRENMPHVIMAYGNRGCGKTTLARILSKYYLCENLTENGPCEECEMCRSVNEILIGGESSQVECPGVTELDATIMNGKEAIQEVLDDALQSPIYSEFKVLIVDECHMISNAGQNSMLKIIEDIPPHLIVIFATTNPEKVLQTIKSRCQLSIEVKKQSIDTMTNRLMQISEYEGLTVSKEALNAIVRNGNRVPRECINLLETIAKTYDREVTIDNVRDYLGEVSSSLYMDYFKAANSSLSDTLIFIRKLRDSNTDSKKFALGLMGFILDSMYIKHGISLDEYPTDYVKAVKSLFDTYESSDFDMLLQSLEYLSKNLTSEDQSRNEVLLTITALRISKIDLLAKGLVNEQVNAISENRNSLVEHSKMLKTDNIAALEKLKMDLSMENINDEFDNIVTIDESIPEETEELELPELQPVESVEETNADIDKLNESVDDFFDN